MRFYSVLRCGAILTALSASLCAQKPVFTEDFESCKIDPAIWEQRVQGTATIAVEAADGAHGKCALHIHYPDTARNSYSFIVNTHLPDSVRTHYFGRAYMKIGPSIGTTHNPFIFTGGTGWPNSIFHELGTSRGKWMPSYQQNKARTAADGRGEKTYHNDPAPNMDKWSLVEWEFNDNPSEITVWVDGERLTNSETPEKIDKVKFEWPAGSGTVNNLVGGYQELGFGLRVWGAPAAPGMDVYYDDIAIGTSRIGPIGGGR